VLHILDNVTTGTQSNNTGDADAYNKIETGTYNEPDETDTYDKPGTYSRSKPVTCEIGTHSTNACEIPPELPQHDNTRIALPLPRIRPIRPQRLSR
jgi:hypothetical protein